MSDPDELALVQKALACGISGCVEWEPKEAERVRNDRYLHGLTPEGIQEAVIDYVQNHGKKVVRQVKETRQAYSYRRFYYKVIVPFPDIFRKGLFVEMELVDEDPDYPEVLLVNAHEQK
jgi:hypothetical protein